MSNLWRKLQSTAKYLWKGPYVATFMQYTELSTEELREYLDQGYDLKTPNDLGYTVMDYCILRGDIDSISLLQSRGIQSNLELHAGQSPDNLFIPILKICIGEHSPATINRSLLKLLKNKKISSTTIKQAIAVFYDNLCNINYEAISPDGKKENVIVLAGENWGTDVWRELMKYPISKDLVPIHYRYFLGMLIH